jgi:hypothetical protein
VCVSARNAALTDGSGIWGDFKAAEMTHRHPTQLVGCKAGFTDASFGHFLAQMLHVTVLSNVIRINLGVPDLDHMYDMQHNKLG